VSSPSGRLQAGIENARPFAADASAKLTSRAGRTSALLPFVLLLALVFVPAAPSASSIQGSLSRAASALAGRPIVVACTNLPGLEGEADAGRVLLDLSTCAPLLHRAAAGPDNVYAAESAAALAHEVGHVLIGACEYRAERYAMVHWRQVYRLVGLGTPDSADAAYVLSMHQALPPPYLSPGPGC
jgi:hypothetical protein